MHYELVHTKIENQVKLKTGSLWPCLKVFTGIKKKKIEKKIFFSMEKKKFSELQNFLDKVNFRKSPHSCVFFQFRMAPEPVLHGHILHEQLQVKNLHLSSCALLCRPF